VSRQRFNSTDNRTFRCFSVLMRLGSYAVGLVLREVVVDGDGRTALDWANVASRSMAWAGKMCHSRTWSHSVS
jgi:hypothetical protein